MAYPTLALTCNHKHNCWFKFDYKTKLSLERGTHPQLVLTDCFPVVFNQPFWDKIQNKDK